MHYFKIFCFTSSFLCTLISATDAADHFSPESQEFMETYQNKDRSEITQHIVSDYTKNATNNAFTHELHVVFVGAGEGREVNAFRKQFQGDYKLTIIEPDEAAIQKGKNRGYILNTDDVIMDTVENASLFLKDQAHVVIWQYYVPAYENVSTTLSSGEAIKNLLCDGGIFYIHSDLNMLRLFLDMNQEYNFYDTTCIYTSNHNAGPITDEDGDMSSRIYRAVKKV